MKRALPSAANPKMEIYSINMRTIVLLIAIQVVSSSQQQGSVLLPIRSFTGATIPDTIYKDRSGRRIRQRHHLIGYEYDERLRMRGGGVRGGSKQKPSPEREWHPLLSNAMTEIESFVGNTVVPTALDVRERFEQWIENDRERKAREREELLKRNELWREIAEQSDNNNNKNNTAPRVSSSYASSSLSESSRAFQSSALKSTASLKSVLLPTRVLKLSLLALILAEALDRIGILDEDTPQIVRARIEHFWRYDVIRLCESIRSKLELWYCRRVRWWVLQFFHMWENDIEMGRGWISMYSHSGSSIDPPVWSTTKVAFAISTACGMIATPLMFSWSARLFRPVLVVALLAETNHFFKERGQKFIGLLGETPHTLGATLDGLLDRCRHLLRRLMRKMGGSRNAEWYCEGHGSGSSSRGAVNDRYGDATVMGLMGGVGNGVSRIEPSNGVDYSLGLSAYREHQTASEIEIYNRKRRAMTRQGLVVGCAIGLAMKGR
jgi:hypothetical protein